MKRLFSFLLIASLVACGSSKSSSNQSDHTFGVFLGANDSSVTKLMEYSNVAIELEEFPASSVASLKKKNIGIYAYLSIGSLEDYRDYYDEFKDYTFMDYENWEHERWIDVSQPSWQKHLVDTAKALKSLGADGIFMDNFDVYYVASEEYECSNEFKEGIYQGCKTILNDLHNLELKLVINSGTTFLERLSTEKCGCINYFEWYAQESVFSTIIDCDNDVFGTQDEEEHEYYLEMIDLMKHYSKVLMIEYTKDSGLVRQIKEYAFKNGVHYFISEKVNLE